MEKFALLLSLVFMFGCTEIGGTTTIPGVPLGGNCTLGVDNCTATNAVCGYASTENCLLNKTTCICPLKYTNMYGDCVENMNSEDPQLGEACDASVTCSAGDSHCPGDCTLTCQCDAGYTQNGDSCVIAAIEEGSECSESSECVENAECRNEGKTGRTGSRSGRSGKRSRKKAGKKAGKTIVRRCRCIKGHTARDGQCVPRESGSSSSSSSRSSSSSSVSSR